MEFPPLEISYFIFIRYHDMKSIRESPKIDSPNPSSQPPSAKPDPMEIIASGLTQNSPILVQQGLDIFANSRRGLDSTTLDRVLNFAVKRAKPDIVRYLLDKTGCTVEKLRPYYVGVAVGFIGKGEDEECRCEVGDVIGVLEALVERGWDINGRYSDR